MLRPALAYARKGVPVFPCNPATKSPLTVNGFHDATTVVEQIKIWWERWPEAMIGMPTGDISGFSAIDIGLEALPSTLQRYIVDHRHGAAKQRTPKGGYHLVYLNSGRVRSYNHGRGSPDVDIKAMGGYIILPPSVNAEGKSYKWVNGGLSKVRAQFPIEFREVLVGYRGRPKRRVGSLQPQNVEVGERYPAARTFMSALFHRNTPKGELLEQTQLFCEKMPEPPPPDQWNRLVNFADWLEEHNQSEEDDFWDQTDILRHIRAFAQANRAAPLPVLGCVIARTASATHPLVRLPGRGAGQVYGSLNTFVALVGESGAGKDQAIATAAMAVDVGDEQVHQGRLGSGEGFAHGFKHRARKGEGEMADGTGEIWDHHSVLFSESEIESVIKLGGRQGATLIPELRSAWSGGKLGHLFSDPMKRLNIPEHSYRMCLIAGMQPSKAGPFLDDEAGGLPQRFLWLMVADRYAPIEIVVSPQPKVLVPAFNNISEGEPVVMQVCHEAQLVIDDRAVRVLRGELSDPLKSHWLQAKLRVAAALALLHGVEMVSTEFWDLADWIMHKSDEGRIFCAHVARLESERQVKSAGRREGVKLMATEEERYERLVSSARRIILNSLDEDEWTKEGQISRKLGKSEYREHMKSLLTELRENKTIERRTLKSSRGQAGYVYRKL